jgi:hypothetical protein
MAKMDGAWQHTLNEFRIEDVTGFSKYLKDKVYKYNYND